MRKENINEIDPPIVDDPFVLENINDYSVNSISVLKDLKINQRSKKRKIQFDENIELHPNFIKNQLINTRDIITQVIYLIQEFTRQ